jgi:hypothetical protein
MQARIPSEICRIPSKLRGAGVAELADAQDLKSCDPKGSCGFDPRPRHKTLSNLRECCRLEDVTTGTTPQVSPMCNWILPTE